MTILDTPCDEGWTEYTERGKKNKHNKQYILKRIPISFPTA